MVGLLDRVSFALPLRTREDTMVGQNRCVRYAGGVGVAGKSGSKTADSRATHEALSL